MTSIKQLFHLLTPDEHKRAILLLCMIILMAFLEMIGVASIMPFISVLTNPSIIDSNKLLNSLFEFSSFFGVENKNQFFLFLGFVVFFLLVISLSFKAVTIYFQLRFTSMCQYSISKRVVKGYLHQQYSWFLNRNSADLGKTVLSEIGGVVSNGLKPLINLIAQSMVTFAILILLIIVDASLALIVCFTFGLAYSLIYKYFRGFITRIGKERVEANKKRFLALSEAFGAIKPIKIGGLEKFYMEKFSKPAKTFALHQASSQVVNQLPRYVLEGIAFGGLLSIILFLLIESGNFYNHLPVLALYALAGYRLMPALQGIYGSIAQLRFISPAINSLYKDILSLKMNNENYSSNVIQLNNEIVLKNICYNYPESSRIALHNINLKIPVGSKVGIVGPTGCGKTTTVNIILGLLTPEKGSLEVDGKIIDKNNLRIWQNSIGYVPQQIYLSDDTIEANIAFGIKNKDIDFEAVKRAARIASLDEFVSNELQLKYQTVVGERGMRLSGGQRQRIGIARALYHQPQVLILDEATSALDNYTEQEVMEAVYKIGNKITIIMIAHRSTTVKKCDNIILLEKGKLKKQGTFKELIQDNKSY